jgi:hypothetical membrane protein
MLAMVEPGYSIAANFISELALGPNGLVFAMTMVIWGGFVAIAAAILYRVSASDSFFPSRLFAILLCVGGLGIVGSGLIPMGTSHIYGMPLHFYLTTVGALSALVAIFVGYKLVDPPFSYIQLFIGGLALLTTVLVLTATDLGLGPGGMERMNAYSFIVWVFGLSAYLMSKSNSE